MKGYSQIPFWAKERDVEIKSDNFNEADSEQRRLLSSVMDVDRVRAWLIQRIAEHALEIVRQEEQTDGNAEINLNGDVESATAA